VEVLDLSGNPVGDPNPTFGTNAAQTAATDGDSGIVCWFNACLKNMTLKSLDLRRVANSAATSRRVWNFVQRSSELQSAVAARDHAAQSLKQYEARQVGSHALLYVYVRACACVLSMMVVVNGGE
jgi:hypothetical protein